MLVQSPSTYSVFFLLKLPYIGYLWLLEKHVTRTWSTGRRHGKERREKEQTIRRQNVDWRGACKRRRMQEETLCARWTFFTRDCGSHWHMKYERQQHSPLFIALQERKMEKAATALTLRGRAGMIFSFAKKEKEELCPVFRMHIYRCNCFGQTSWVCEQTCVWWLNMPLHLLFLNSQSKADASGKHRLWLRVSVSNPSVARHYFMQTAKNVSVRLGNQQHVLFRGRLRDEKPKGSRAKVAFRLRDSNYAMLRLISNKQTRLKFIELLRPHRHKQ